MQQFFNQNLSFSLPTGLFLKDPESSDTGKRIVEQGIILMDQWGFENFSFRKLSNSLGSPESTIYRYFENKHSLLLFFSSWYWSWLHYRLAFAVANVVEPQERLRRAMETICKKVEPDQDFSHIDELRLQRIVIAESTKTFLTKGVEQETKNGLFRCYQDLIALLAEILSSIDTRYPSPKATAVLLLESYHLQRYFSEHLPMVSDLPKTEAEMVDYFMKICLSPIRHGAD